MVSLHHPKTLELRTIHLSEEDRRWGSENLQHLVTQVAIGSVIFQRCNPHQNWNFFLAQKQFVAPSMYCSGSSLQFYSSNLYNFPLRLGIFKLSKTARKLRSNFLQAVGIWNIFGNVTVEQVLSHDLSVLQVNYLPASYHGPQYSNQLENTSQLFKVLEC